ncbi:hypothetical protein CEP54_009978 [Fusarium duplospermum]|uniref:Uncharacterized protein n=1 Tax=Fusarium duplospermum TaxID=1325734 RepID=A0A428PMJ2_9HYPO|nr:hypothetical protein CEP54_009978 [Fusarium duplospermum]
MRDAARDRDMPRLKRELERWHMLKAEELKPPGRLVPRWPYIIHREFVSVARVMAEEGNSEMIGYLLEMGLRYETDVIVRAARRCHWGVIKVHMDSGWRIDGYLNTDSEPPLLGRLLHKEECVRGLLELGANPKGLYGDATYDVPHLAGKTASPAVMQLLRENGVDFNETNALHEAAHREGDLQIDTMAYLLDEVGVPINRVALSFEDKCLDWAGYKVEFLVGRGADPNVKDWGGKSPLDWAKEKGFGDAVRVLREINSQR